MAQLAQGTWGKAKARRKERVVATDESGRSTIEVSRWPVGAGPLNRIEAPPTRKID